LKFYLLKGHQLYFGAIYFQAQCKHVMRLCDRFLTIARRATENGSNPKANAFHLLFVFELSLQQ